MEVPIFLVADCANISDNGKINIMGVFQDILAPAFPTVHPTLVLILKLIPDFDEYGVERNLTIKLVDGNGKDIFRLNFQIKFGLPVEGKRPETIQIMELNGLMFPKPDKYHIALLIENEQKARLGIEVIQISPQIPNTDQ